MQLAGDPGAFVLGRAAQRLGLLAFQRGQPRPALVGAAFPPAQPVGRDGDRDQDQERDGVVRHGRARAGSRIWVYSNAATGRLASAGTRYGL